MFGVYFSPHQRNIASQSQETNSLETRVILTEICYIEIYRAAQNTGDHFKKNHGFPEGNKLFAGDFCDNLDKTNADMVQFTNWK